MKTFCAYYTNFERVEFEVVDGQVNDDFEINVNKWRWSADGTSRE
jgi:hypothetical protein